MIKCAINRPIRNRTCAWTTCSAFELVRPYWSVNRFYRTLYLFLYACSDTVDASKRFRLDAREPLSLTAPAHKLQRESHKSLGIHNTINNNRWNIVVRSGVGMCEIKKMTIQLMSWKYLTQCNGVTVSGTGKLKYGHSHGVNHHKTQFV